MQNASNGQAAYLATNRQSVQEFFHRISPFSVWPLGACVAVRYDGHLAIYETEDREKRKYLLYVVPLSFWDQVESTLSHIDWVNRSIMGLSPYYSAVGPMVQEAEWSRSGAFSFGIIPNRSLPPALSAFPQVDLSSRIMNMVQLAALLRFLPLHQPENIKEDLNTTRNSFVSEADALAVSLERRLHGVHGIPERWISFHRHNTESVARTHDFTPVLAVGSFLSTCLVYCVKRRAFFLRGPFYFSAGECEDDLCRVLFLFRRLHPRDRQYLIDFYFNLDVPNQFFTFLAHRHMSTLLQKLAESEKGSAEEKEVIRDLVLFSESRDAFRTPVPLWYKYPDLR